MFTVIRQDSFSNSPDAKTAGPQSKQQKQQLRGTD